MAGAVSPSPLVEGGGEEEEGKGTDGTVLTLTLVLLRGNKLALGVCGDLTFGVIELVRANSGRRLSLSPSL